MKPKLLRLTWVVVLAAALAWIWHLDSVRVERIDYIGGLGEAGRPSGGPQLVVPGRINSAYEWLEQTRAMREKGAWRLRTIDYENAPYGRPVLSSSLYRDWLGALTGAERRLRGLDFAAALEAAGKLADPLVQVLALLLLVSFAARLLGGWAAAALAVGLAAAYPLGGDYLPGVPGERGLACALALASLLLLAAGLREVFAPAETSGRPAGRAAFAWAGILGGLGMWVGAAAVAPLLIGVVLGGLALGIGFRRGPVLPWRAWSWAGAASVLAAYAFEYAPRHLLDGKLEFLHPAFAAAWFGAGELLACASARLRGTPPASRTREMANWALALAGLLAVPACVWRGHDKIFLALDLSARRLARLPNAPSALTLADLCRSQGFSLEVAATLLPAALLLAAAAILLRRAGPAWIRAGLSLAVGAAAAALAWSGHEIRAWDAADAALLAVAALLAGAILRPGRARAAAVGAALVISAAFALWLPGAAALAPGTPPRGPVDETEVYQLVERDLAWWLAARAGSDGVVALGPQNLTYTLQYYGRIRGLATLAWDNPDGLQAAVRIASASTPEEAKELIDRRGVTHLVLPSWDPYMEVFARMGMGELQGTFLSRLETWRLPPWLRPLPYPVPAIPGFEGASLLVLKVVPPQDEATAVSRVGEYFVETGQLGRADEVAAALRRYPANMGAWVARAEVAVARGDGEALEGALRVLLPRLNSAAVRNLPWDRRVALGIVLAEAKRFDLARGLIGRCFAQGSKERLQDLSARSVYRLLLLARAFGEVPPGSPVWADGLSVLPSGFRDRLTR